jgi:predicted CopG family antitoxin
MHADKDPISGPSESVIAKFIKRKEPVDGVITPSDELAQLEEKIKEEAEAEK